MHKIIDYKSCHGKQTVSRYLSLKTTVSEFVVFIITLLTNNQYQIDFVNPMISDKFKVISLNAIVFPRRNINTHPWTRNKFSFKIANFQFFEHEICFYSIITNFLFAESEILQTFLINLLLLHGNQCC